MAFGEFSVQHGGSDETMIVEHDVSIRHEQYNAYEIEVLFKGEYVKFVRERTGTMLRDEYGYWVCSECGKDLPAWVTEYPADYCPYCGMKVVEDGR